MAIDTNVLSKLDKLPLEEARKLSIEMLQSLKENKHGGIARLIRDVQAAKNSRDICGIMYRTVLAGEGLRTTTSTWTRV